MLFRSPYVDGTYGKMNLAKPQSAIVVIIIGDNKKVLDIAKNVCERGFLISAIRPPTVEANKARLRITFSSAHKKSQIEKLAKIISDERLDVPYFRQFQPCSTYVPVTITPSVILDFCKNGEIELVKNINFSLIPINHTQKIGRAHV